MTSLQADIIRPKHSTKIIINGIDNSTVTGQSELVTVDAFCGTNSGTLQGVLSKAIGDVIISIYGVSTSGGSGKTTFISDPLTTNISTYAPRSDVYWCVKCISGDTSTNGLAVLEASTMKLYFYSSVDTSSGWVQNGSQNVVQAFTMVYSQ